MRTSGLCWLAAVVLLAGCGKKPHQEIGAELRWAAWNGDLGQVQTLIAKGIPVNTQNGTGRTPLHDAACNGHKEVVEILVRCGATIDAMDQKGRTPVTEAMENNRRAVVEYLVGQGAAVNLCVAAYLGDAARVKGLIEAGADVNAKDSNTWTPLHYAASRGHLEVARVLITARADLNAKGDSRSFVQEFDSGTPLHLAVRGDHAELVGLLMDKGANPEVRDKYGRTPLERAIVNGRLALVRLLIAKGANPNARAKEDHFGSGTPLGIAINCGYVDIAETLIIGGADVNARDESGWTPLHVAVTGSYDPALEAAVPMKPPDLAEAQAVWDRYRALSEKAHAVLVVRMLQVLTAHGADVTAKDKESITALHCAAYHGLRDAVELLIAGGRGQRQDDA